MKNSKYIKTKKYKSTYYYTVQIVHDGGSYSKTFNSNNYNTPKEAFRAACLHRDEKVVEFNKRGLPSTKKVVRECYDSYFRLFPTPIRTKKNYDSIYRNYIQDPFGMREIATITELDIQRCLNSMVYDCSNDMISRTFTAWKKIFMVAMMERAVTFNPCDLVIVPTSKKIKRKKKQDCTDQEVDMIVEAIGKPCGNEEKDYNNTIYTYAIRVLQLTGIRPAELYPLHKKDIDLRNNVLHIHCAYGSDQDGEAITNCKTESSVRDIPITNNLEFVFRALLQFAKHEYPFMMFDGTFINTNKFSSRINYISKKINVEFHLYMLRHNFSTKLLQGGADIRSVMELMGHSGTTGAMTLDYARSNDDIKREAISLVEKSRKTINKGLS